MPNYYINCQIISDGDTIIYETHNFNQLRLYAIDMLKQSGFFEYCSPLSRLQAQHMDIGRLFCEVERHCEVEIRIREDK